MVHLRIKEMCKQKGITQAELAHRLGIKPVSFSQAVSRNKFDLCYLERIADCIGCNVVDLFQEEGNTFVCPRCGAKLSVNEIL